MKLEQVNELPSNPLAAIIVRFQALPLNLRVIASLEILSGIVIAAILASLYASGSIEDELWGIQHITQFAIALAALQLLGGIGMLLLKTWAYKIVTFTGVIRMVSIPIGTIWGAWIIYAFNKELR